MKIAATCIKHHVMTTLVFILIAVFGFYGFRDLPLALMPDMELPVAVVVTTYVGASPDDVEQQVTRPVESACASLSGLDTMSSTSSEDMSLVVLQFADGTNMDSAMADLRDKTATVEAGLPDGVSAPMVMNIDIDSMPVISVALRGADLGGLQTLAEDEIAPALERLDGVASVDISGGYENEIAVHVDPTRMKGYNLTLASVAEQIGADNIAIPGGSMDSGSQTLAVRTDGQYETVEDIQNALISLPAGGTIRLAQIADVALQPKDRDAMAKVNGEECLILSVNKQSGSNTVEIAERAKAELDTLTAENASLNWDLIMDQSDYINMTVDNAISNILMGVVFAAVVLILFLRDLGATVAISVAMPVCILCTFLIMYGLDITLNMMSLGGIALGVGMIVDNSIVVLDNIFRYRADGCSRWDSCVQGASEVTLSVTASTLTTVAVFLPIGLSGGITGMMFKEFCITIVALLMSSLVIALTLVPLLCYILLDRGEKRRVRVPMAGVQDLADKPLMRKYKKVLGLFITRRSIGIAFTFAVCAVSIVCIALTGSELIPQVDEGQVSITVDLPNGTSVEDSAAIEDRIAAIVMETVPEAEQVYYTTGSSSSIMSSTSGASVTVLLCDLEDRKRSTREVATQLRRDLSDIAGCELTISGDGTMSSMMSSNAISLVLSGRDYDELSEAANALADEIARLPDAINVESSASEQVPRVAVRVNRENASRFGLSAAAIGGLVRSEMTGSAATTLSLNGEEYDVTVSGNVESTTSLNALKAMQLPSMTGGTVPLSMVADIETELAPQSIERKNQYETVTITGQSESGNDTELNQRVQELLANYTLPEGVEIDDSDNAAASIAESTQTLLKALGVAILLVYFILASQFNSFVLPVAIMLILPIGLLGSLSLLGVTGNKVSMVALLAVVILAGTVVNSSIVLIDYIQQRRARGEEKNEAILNACPRRVRPVLMTTLTTILGLVPMVFSGGEGAELMRPMGIVMMTGMVVSTIATLFITPVYYSLIDSLAAWVSGRFRRHGDDGKGGPDQPPRRGPAHLLHKKRGKTQAQPEQPDRQPVPAGK